MGALYLQVCANSKLCLIFMDALHGVMVNKVD